MLPSCKYFVDIYIYNVEYWTDCIWIADECFVPDGKVCFNGGSLSCVCQNGNATCLCRNGYTGEACEIPPGMDCIS